MLVERMLNDNVLVDPISAEAHVTDGGIHLPGKSQCGRGTKATVLSVGPGCKLDDGTRYALDLKAGSIVLLAEKSGDTVILDGSEYLVVPERYILAVISEPEDGPGKKPNHPTGLADTPENRIEFEKYNDGDCISIDGDGNIIKKKEEN